MFFCITKRFGSSALLPAALIAALFLAPVLCSGSVFWRRPGAMSDSFIKANPLRSEIYTSDITINSGKGVLKVIGCEEPLGAVKNWLERNFSNRAVVVSAGMITGFLKGNDTVTRVVALDMGVYSQTVVFWMEQSVAEYKKSGQAPHKSAIPDIPVFPGSDFTLSVGDNNRGTRMEIITAPAEADEAAQFFKSAMTSLGWALLSPSGPLARRSRQMNIFVKDGDICCILAGAGTGHGSSVITILHKKNDVR